MFQKSFFIASLLFSLSFLVSCYSTYKHSTQKHSDHKQHHKHSKKSCSHSKKSCSHSKKSCSHSKKSCSHSKKSCCGSNGLSGKAYVTPVNTGGPKGFVIFEKADHKKVRVRAKITNLKANQKFGFHVHEFGDCSDKALKAGGHLIVHPHRHKKSFFNKKRTPSLHGGPLSPEKHAGDLGNLSSDSKGEALYDKVLPGHFRKFLGRSVIVHAKEDDLKTQPTGNSGERIACGIIGATLTESQ